MATRRSKSPAGKLERKRTVKTSSEDEDASGGEVATLPREGPITAYGLTVREWRFVDAYLGEASGNAVDAARIAGYGNTYVSAAVASDRLLNRDRVKAVIADRLGRHAMSSASTIHLLTQMLQANMGDYLELDRRGDIVFDDKGRPKIDLQRAKRNGKLHLIESMTFTEDRVTIKLPKRNEVIGLMMKFHGLIRETLDVSVQTDGEQVRRELFAKLMDLKAKAEAAEQATLRGLPSPSGEAEVEVEVDG